jgi:hypothetical protein
LGLIAMFLKNVCGIKKMKDFFWKFEQNIKILWPFLGSKPTQKSVISPRWEKYGFYKKMAWKLKKTCEGVIFLENKKIH